MGSQTLCNSLDGEQSMCDGSAAPMADYLETIAILQDEIARLEQELQSRIVSQY